MRKMLICDKITFKALLPTLKTTSKRLHVHVNNTIIIEIIEINNSYT